MKEKDYDEVEQLIGYEFKRRLLLQQAFTRKSYTNETHDGDNNEVLEFIGDKVLDLVVVKVLSEYYGEVNNRDEFACELNEGKLTELKKSLVEGKMLASRIDELGFNKYLIMGNGDRKNNAQNDTHVKEDLFEAILGAVAIDSNWDMESMQDSVELMLDIDYYLENGFDGEDNYVSNVQQWCQKRKGELPHYNFYDRDELEWRVYNAVVYSKDSGDVVCDLQIDDVGLFIGYGYTKNQARMSAAKMAYDYLDDEGLLISMEDEIGEPTPDRAVSQLHELFQKGYFSMPKYIFNETHDKNGNPVWRCECHISDYDYYYWNNASSKKDAKRKAAYDMLISILDADGSDNGGNNDDDWDD